MGIRFLCSSCGKKLNIKVELAGKKGRCPKCNEKITIPKESSLEQVEDPPKFSENTSAANNSNESVSAKEIAVQVAVKPASQEPASQKPKSSKPKSSKPDSPKPEPAATKRVNKSSRSTQSTASQNASAPKPSPQTIEAETAQKDSPPPLPSASDQTEIEGPAATPVAEPQPKTDVFAEAPEANWFVRPSSGGQFGPAEPDVMKGWLSEGRVGADSLVWREGWEEWQTAGDVFQEELSAVAEPPTEQQIESRSSTSQSASQTNRSVSHQMARKKARTMGIVLVVGLAIVSITLAVVLFFVVKNSQENKSNNNNDKKETASLSIDVQKNHNQRLSRTERQLYL